MANQRGVVAYISNPSNTRILIQRKDGKYPYANQRRTVCLFGGHIEGSESNLEALLRELEEKINYRPILDAARSKFDYRYSNNDVVCMVLPSQVTSETFFTISAYPLVISDKTLDDLESKLYTTGVINEGYGEIVSRDYLTFLIEHHPNDFFSSISLLFSILV